MEADLTALQKRFRRAGFLKFEIVNGLVRIQVSSPVASATVYLQGAHLAAWQPSGEPPVIFFSRKSDIAPGKPFRGGVPVAFPWFANDKKPDRVDGHPGPSHGFARIQDWTLRSAEHKGNDVELVFSLGPTELSRSMGFDHFELRLAFVIGRTLTMKLTVTNVDQKPLTFEEALHTYYHVMDVQEIAVSGLEEIGFIDKRDNFLHKPAEHASIRFTKTTDRIYENARGTCVIHDGAGQREITVRKTGSDSTVVWTPFQEQSDIGAWDWHEMVAVETANVESNAITLAPGASHDMSVTVSVKKSS